MTSTKPKRSRSWLEQLISDVHSHGINYHTREIYCHSVSGHSDEEPGVDYRMATSFIKNLHILSNEKTANILVHLHCIGGEWSDGLAMMNAVTFSKSPVTMLAYAQASSMSGIVLQCADKRVLMPDCEFMLHHGSISIYNDAVRASSAIESNNRSCKRMLQIFARRAKVGQFFQEKEWPEAKIEKFLDDKLAQKGDWYLNAEEALYYGLADGILGQKGFETIEAIRRGRKYRETI